MATFDDLLNEMQAMPVIDVYARLRPDAPKDADQAAMCGEIRAELASANVPSEVLDVSSAKKMREAAAEYLPRIANTIAHWSLTQLSESGVERVLYAYEWFKPAPRTEGVFAPNMSIDSLINEAHTSRMLDRLSNVTDMKVYEVDDLRKAVAQLFRLAREAGVLAACVALEPQTDFEPGDRGSADRILSLVLLGQKVNRDDRRALRSYVMDQVLANCHEHRMPIQLHLGTKWVRGAEREISAFEPSMGAMYAELFARHGATKFDLILANETLAHEFAVLSRQFRNVFLSGAGPFLAYPSVVRKVIRERIEMLPMTKCCALASGAEQMEWVYARAALIRRELAFVLTQMVDEGYLTRQTALEVARHCLLENPKRIYKIE